MQNESLENLIRRTPKNYTFEYRDRGSRTLLVIFSPSPNPALLKYGFSYSTLHVADKFLTFYTFRPQSSARAILKFASEQGKDRIVFIGSSKGGTGAILWSTIANKFSNGIYIQCISFSPQTQLFPCNPVLGALPSYQISLDRVSGKGRFHLAEDFKKFGNLEKVCRGEMPISLIVYSSSFTMDRVEAKRLSGLPGARLRPLKLPFHGSITPYVMNPDDSEASTRLAKKLYADANADPDLAASLPAEMDMFIAAMRKSVQLTLSDLIEEEISRATVHKLRWLRTQNRALLRWDRFRSRVRRFIRKCLQRGVLIDR